MSKQKSNSRLKVKDRFVAFLDVLGFKDVIKNTDEVIRIIEIVESATMKASISNDSHGIIPTEQIRSTVISDSIILSISVPDSLNENYKSLRYLLSAVEKIQYRCALKNVWLRGGLACGPLHHSENNMFGEGLVDAYLLEKNAKYPRVLVDPNIIRRFERMGGASTKKAFIENMNMTWGSSSYSGKFLYDRNCEEVNGMFSSIFLSDVPLFVNYLNPFFSSDVDDDVRKNLVSFLKERLYSAQSPEVYSKYKWVLDYLLSLIPIGADLTVGCLPTLTAL